MRDPVQIHLQLDERRIRLLEDDVVAHLPVLLDELEVVVMVGELQAGFLDRVASDVEPLRDDLELLDGSRVFVEQRPGDVLLAEDLGAFN